MRIRIMNPYFAEFGSAVDTVKDSETRDVVATLTTLTENGEIRTNVALHEHEYRVHMRKDSAEYYAAMWRYQWREIARDVDSAAMALDAAVEQLDNAYVHAAATGDWSDVGSAREHLRLTEFIWTRSTGIA